MRAECYASCGQPRKALADYAKAISLDPKSSTLSLQPGRNNLVCLLQAFTAINQARANDTRQVIGYCHSLKDWHNFFMNLVFAEIYVKG